ncbi:MAG: hypothetical protein FD170_3856 [Bacteroidetes bacterium]|nr:MAG: hypothetical protein FD170_3856 [Bacteroidota bacterium]
MSNQSFLLLEEKVPKADEVTIRLGDGETGRQGDRETGRQGDRETRRQGDRFKRKYFKQPFRFSFNLEGFVFYDEAIRLI